MQKVLEERIKALPEVERVFAKIGTANVATDAVPPSVADNFIIIKPRSEWPNPNKTKEQLVAELEELVTPVPGNRYEFLQPIQMRFNELLAGVRAELAIKVFGDDFDTLAELGKEIETAIQDVEGIRDVQVEQTKGLPVLTFLPHREKLALYGLSLEDFQTQVAVSMGGQVAGKFYEGDKRFDIVARLPEEKRQDVNSLSNLPISLPNGEHIPLKELADMEVILGANQVNRENGKRRVVVTANVRGRDLGSFVQDIQAAIKSKVKLPASYWIEYGGTYQKLQSASERLSIVVGSDPFLCCFVILRRSNHVRSVYE